MVRLKRLFFGECGSDDFPAFSRKCWGEGPGTGQDTSPASPEGWAGVGGSSAASAGGMAAPKAEAARTWAPASGGRVGRSASRDGAVSLSTSGQGTGEEAGANRHDDEAPTASA